MPKFRKKPVVIDAVQFDGHNGTEIMLFVGKTLAYGSVISHMEREFDNIPNEAYSIIIPTLEGDMRAIKTDWIIRGIQGEYYPCKDDIFRETYETA